MRQEDARIHLPPSPRDLRHGSRVREDRDRFQKTRPLLGGHQDACGDTVSRDLNGIAAFFDAPKQFQE
jgi:hypothetical protein